jgi:hypothetical protein
MATKPTGPSSTSFQVWLATFLPGLASAISAILQNGTAAHQAVFGLGGGAVMLGSTIFKLIHDQGLNKATLATAGSDLVKALPDLRLDLSKSVSFIENDVPAFKDLVDGVDGRLKALEAKAPELPAIETMVRSVLSELLAGK